MRKFFVEFKNFALRGNMMDLAVGVLIGAAFQGIVNSLVSDIISPVIGIFAKTNFSDLQVVVGNATIKYGAFITALLNFVIMAFVVFLLVKTVNSLRSIGKKEEDATTKKCPYCLTEISLAATRCPHCTSLLHLPEGEKSSPLGVEL